MRTFIYIHIHVSKLKEKPVYIDCNGYFDYEYVQPGHEKYYELLSDEGKSKSEKLEQYSNQNIVQCMIFLLIALFSMLLLSHSEDAFLSFNMTSYAIYAALLLLLILSDKLFRAASLNIPTSKSLSSVDAKKKSSRKTIPDSSKVQEEALSGYKPGA